MITKSIKERIAAFFFEHPTRRLRVRRIEREARVPLPSAIRYAKDLTRDGILKRETESGVTFYSADRSNSTYLFEKRLWNLRHIRESGLLDRLREEYGRPTVVLFGSFARGEDTEYSDADLLVITPSTRHIIVDNPHWTGTRKLHILQHKSLREIPNKELVNNIANGIVLEGFLEIT